jgi:hypothetical protein
MKAVSGGRRAARMQFWAVEGELKRGECTGALHEPPPKPHAQSGA